MEETATIIEAGTHDFVFAARAGVRYDVDVRVGEEAIGAVWVGDASRRNDEPLCRCNSVESLDLRSVCDPRCDFRFCNNPFAPMDCSRGCLWCNVQPGACSDGLPSSPGTEISSLACAGVTVEVPKDGVTGTLLFILPPGATESGHAVASQTTNVADKGLGFTAAATGDFTANLYSFEGSGPVNLRVTAVGTAEQRSPPVVADGAPHVLEVSCLTNHCRFGYDGTAAYDGDGGGFDLRLPNAEAGIAYAVSILLPRGHTAAQVTATFYQADAAAGSAGFSPTVDGPLGEWPTTPPGHQSYAEYGGCSNADRSCISEIRASYGIHPGGRFGAVLKGTWVAPAGGVWLLRVVANCAVPFYHDVQAEGCQIDQTSYNCQQTAAGTYNSDCTSALELTVTPNAYFYDDDVGPSGATTSGEGEVTVLSTPVTGGVERTDTIALSREQVEAMAAAMFAATPPEERTVAASPTLEEMVTAGTAANAMLFSMLTTQQQPHVVYPLIFTGDSDTSGAGKGGGHHRRTQQRGDSLRVRIETHAPTPSEAHRAVTRLISDTGASLVESPTPNKGRRILVETHTKHT